MDGHDLYTPADFTNEEMESSSTARLVVLGGLGICKKCGAGEAQLDKHPTCESFKADKVRERVIEYLRGTADTLSAALIAFDAEDLEDDTEFLARLDGEIFNCSQCGWWCEIDEEASDDIDSDELVCVDCASEAEGVGA
ncbi:MAG: hypothetical protein ABJI29_03205 [Alphaproteobacteria bacterium]|uniref:hypothetical protein n=1 Tax=Shimia sp. TaxID=1954381 RepID=UPI00329706C6